MKEYVLNKKNDVADVNIDELLKMSDAEIYKFVDEADSFDAYGVEECMSYLIKRYDIPEKNEFGEWILGDELLDTIKKAMIEE